MAARASLAIALAISAGAVVIAVGATACVPSRRPPVTSPPAVRSSPGPLASGHGGLGCRDCHVDNSREVASMKCLGCHAHDALRARIAAGRGYHATAGVRRLACGGCHLDHRGGAYDLRGWPAVAGGEDGFDHELTGWPLHGKHARPCATCHTAVDRHGLRTYVGLDRACITCHAGDQPHQLVRRDLACERCHRDQGWKPARARMEFDHDGDTPMALTGAHAGARCVDCHAGGVFNLPEPAASCESCHASPHVGHLFDLRACESCHSPKIASPTAVDFAHPRFELGAHRKHACISCHTRELGATLPSSDCTSCHANDSPHGTRWKAFGSPPACGACHGSGSWRASRFNHGRQTKFALKDQHAELACRACHRGQSPDVFERLAPAPTCKGCHAHARVHADDTHPDGRYTTDECLTCHMQRDAPAPGVALREAHGYDARFPLMKRHARLRCAECHTGGSAPGSDAGPPECAARCHVDAHGGARGEDCHRCHTPGTWEVPDPVGS